MTYAQQIIEHLEEALESARLGREEAESDSIRYWSIVVTDLERVLAQAKQWLPNTEPAKESTFGTAFWVNPDWPGSI